jgi:hypothetical protein
MESSRRALFKTRNLTLGFDPKLPESLAEVRRWFQLRQAITFDLCVVSGIRGYRCICLIERFVPVPSIRRSNRRFIPNRRFCARLRRGSSSPMSLHHYCTKGFLVFLRFSSVQSLPLPPPAVAPLPLPSTLAWLPPRQWPAAGTPAPRLRRGRPARPSCTAPPLPLPIPWLRGRRRRRKKKMTVL